MRIMKSPISRPYSGEPSDDPKQRWPDISLAKERLGWEPITHLDEGLKKVIDHFKRN